MDFKNRFVCPIPKFLRGKILELNRLYAYPVIPEPLGDAEFRILDSGGYALWKQKREMSKKYINELAAHYKRYSESGSFNAAPDVSQNARKTIKNTEYYLSNFGNNICPIFHFPDSKFDFSLLNYQISAYKSLFGNCDFVFWGGTMDYAGRMLNEALKFKLNLLRDKLNVKWIHFLGAGWNKLEVAKLAQFDQKISFDSLSYYNCIDDKIWCSNDWGNWSEDKTKLAIENAKTANATIQRY